jgi:hypothetical protein
MATCAYIRDLPSVLTFSLMVEHVPMKRLLQVAADDTLIFNQEEFNHLKDCPSCFNEWSQFVHVRVIAAGAYDQFACSTRS